MTTDVSTIKAEAKASTEAAENAFLSKVFAAPEATAPSRSDEEVLDEAVGEQNSTEGEPEAEVEEKPKKGESAQSDSEYEKACSTLALDGYSKTVLGKLDRTEVLELASKAKERHAKTANELKTRAERIKELEEATSAAKETSSPTEASEDDDLKEIRDTYGEEFAASLTKALNRRKSEYEQRIAALEQERVRGIIDGARASLKDQFPQLDDPDKLEKIQVEMGNHLHKYQDLPASERAKMSMRDAARVLFFDEVKASEAGKALAAHRKRIGSQPTPPNGKPMGQKAMTPAEREDALLDAIFRGDTEAKERLMRLS
jgi:hypothetical protein